MIHGFATLASSITSRPGISGPGATARTGHSSVLTGRPTQGYVATAAVRLLRTTPAPRQLSSRQRPRDRLSHLLRGTRRRWADLASMDFLDPSQRSSTAASTRNGVAPPPHVTQPSTVCGSHHDCRMEAPSYHVVFECCCYRTLLIQLFFVFLCDADGEHSSVGYRQSHHPCGG